MSDEAAANERRFTVVLAGAGYAGKSTFLRYVHRLTRGEGHDAPLWPDADGVSTWTFTPLTLARSYGWPLRVSAHTVAGPMLRSEVGRRLVARADGLLCVVDSQHHRLEANREALAQLDDVLAAAHRGEVPRVYAYNKRDLLDAMHLTTLARACNPGGAPGFPTIARDGENVFAALRRLLDELAARR